MAQVANSGGVGLRIVHVAFARQAVDRIDPDALESLQQTPDVVQCVAIAIARVEQPAAGAGGSRRLHARFRDVLDIREIARLLAVAVGDAAVGGVGIKDSARFTGAALLGIPKLLMSSYIGITIHRPGGAPVRISMAPIIAYSVRLWATAPPPLLPSIQSDPTPPYSVP